MNSSYATAWPVPLDADELVVQAEKWAAVGEWYSALEHRHLVPAAAPDAELVDGQVIKVDGRVAITRSWHVWGPVRSPTG